MIEAPHIAVGESYRLTGVIYGAITQKPPENLCFAISDRLDPGSAVLLALVIVEKVVVGQLDGCRGENPARWAHQKLAWGDILDG
jgi:hypothetical protein